MLLQQVVVDTTSNSRMSILEQLKERESISRTRKCENRKRGKRKSYKRKRRNFGRSRKPKEIYPRALGLRPNIILAEVKQVVKLLHKIMKNQKMMLIKLIARKRKKLAGKGP